MQLYNDSKVLAAFLYVIVGMWMCISRLLGCHVQHGPRIDCRASDHIINHTQVNRDHMSMCVSRGTLTECMMRFIIEYFQFSNLSCQE